MAKHAKIDPGVQVICTPRALVFYHEGGEYSCWHPGLAWTELHRHPPDKGQKNPSPPQAKYFHFMRSDILEGAVHKRFPSIERHHCRPMGATVRTSAKDFENYLRRKVWTQKAATGEVFSLLGLKKPPQSAVASSAAVSEHLNELYARAAKLMSLSEQEVRKKYEHLNPGLQAMNLRNRLRARGQAV